MGWVEESSVKVPVRVPEAVGANSIATVQVAAEASVEPQELLARRKSPETLAVPTCAACVPVLLIVRDCAEETVFSIVLVKVSEVGESTRWAGATAAPVRLTEKGLPCTFAAICKVAVRVPAL